MVGKPPQNSAIWPNKRAFRLHTPSLPCIQQCCIGRLAADTWGFGRILDETQTVRLLVDLPGPALSARLRVSTSRSMFEIPVDRRLMETQSPRPNRPGVTGVPQWGPRCICGTGRCLSKGGVRSGPRVDPVPMSSGFAADRERTTLQGLATFVSCFCFD